MVYIREDEEMVGVTHVEQGKPRKTKICVSQRDKKKLNCQNSALSMTILSLLYMIW